MPNYPPLKFTGFKYAQDAYKRVGQLLWAAKYTIDGVENCVFWYVNLVVDNSNQADDEAKLAEGIKKAHEFMDKILEKARVSGLVEIVVSEPNPEFDKKHRDEIIDAKLDNQHEAEGCQKCRMFNTIYKDIPATNIRLVAWPG